MATFLFLTAKDKFRLGKNQVIDLRKLHERIKGSNEFEVLGDAENSISTFNILKLKNKFVYFHLSYMGKLTFISIYSFDFFLKISEFKKRFFRDFVKVCIISRLK